MLPLEYLDRIHVAFDDHRLVNNAGLILPAILAQHLGLPQLVDRYLDLGRAPGRANTGDKIMTLVASALAGGDCIDDADALRAGRTSSVLGCMVKAPSTLGTFLRSFRWGHVRQLDRVSRELLARSWAAGARPGDGPLTIDLDSTICETYGLALGGAVQPRPGPIARPAAPVLTALSATDPTPPNSRPPAPRAYPAASNVTITRFPAFPDRSRSPVRLLKTLCRVTSVPMEPRLSPW